MVGHLSIGAFVRAQRNSVVRVSSSTPVSRCEQRWVNYRARHYSICNNLKSTLQQSVVQWSQNYLLIDNYKTTIDSINPMVKELVCSVLLRNRVDLHPQQKLHHYWHSWKKNDNTNTCPCYTVHINYEYMQYSSDTCADILSGFSL